MLIDEKRQVTPAGRDAHPIPIVSVKSLTEVTLTLIVAFCDEARVSLAGVTVTE